MDIAGKLGADKTLDNFESLGTDALCYESYHDDNIMTQALDEENDSIQVRKQLLE